MAKDLAAYLKGFRFVENSIKLLN